VREGNPIRRSAIIIVGLSLLAAIQGWALLSGVGGQRAGSDPAWPKNGDALGSVQFVGVGSEPAPLATGSPLLLMVFHSGCGHCRDVVPIWRDWIRELKPGVRIAAVTTETREAGALFLASFDWQPEVWTAEPGARSNIQRSLTTRTPWVYLLDGNGVVLAEGHGRLIEDLSADWPEIMRFRISKP
jgi:thiol-disulfide isomerase/thioredoxin